MTGQLIVRSTVAQPSQRDLRRAYRPARSWLWLLTAAAAWLSGRGPVRADSEQVYLDWQPPRSAGCPPRAVVEADVEQALGRRVFTTDRNAPLTVRGVVEQGETEISVRLDARSAQGKLLGTRELHALDCASLRNSLGLVLTLLVDREAQPPEPTPELRPGFWAGVMGGVLPRAAVGVGPNLSLRLGNALELRADAAYWLPVQVQTEAGKRALLHGVSLTPRVCPRLAGSAQSLLDLRLCAGAQLGVWIVAQSRPDVPAPELRLLAQLLVELRSALRVPPLTLELSVGPLIVLNRTSLYAVQDDGARVLLYRMPVLGLFVGLGLII